MLQEIGDKPRSDDMAPAPRARRRVPLPRFRRRRDDRPPRPKLKKLRLLFILLGLSGIAFVSTVFGMMMAVASDLPALEDREQFKHAKNSVLLDFRGRDLGVLTDNHNIVLLNDQQIPDVMKHAIIAVED